MASFLYKLLAILLSATLFGLLAKWYFAAELATHFAWQYFLGSLGLTLFFAALKKKRALVISGLLLAYHAAHILPLWLPITGDYYGPEFTLVQFNINSANPNTDEIIKWLASEKFDVVLLQEVSPAFAKQLELLKPIYPYQITQPRLDNFGSALISKTSFKTAQTLPLSDGWNHYIRAEITLEEPLSLHLYGLHTLPPILAANAQIRNTQLREIADAVHNDTAPFKILMGDFNLTPYSPNYTELLHTTNMDSSLQGYGVQNSWPAVFPLDILRIPIDQILVSKNIAVISRKIGPNFGSDHFSVISRLAIR